MRGRVEAGVLHPGAMGASLGAALRQDVARDVARHSSLVLNFHDALNLGSKTHPWPVGEIAQLLAAHNAVRCAPSEPNAGSGQSGP